MTTLTPEHSDKLAAYVDLLLKWNRTINLISETTEEAVWDRHINDSVQLAALMGGVQGSIVDMGSGGGLPGIVLAVVMEGQAASVTLVERDKRKAVFLKEVSRQLSLQCRVVQGDVAAITPLGADVVTARAFAPLGSLIGLLAHHAAPGGFGLFPKGRAWQSELDLAAKEWQFTSVSTASETDPMAAILKISNAKRRSHG